MSTNDATDDGRTDDGRTDDGRTDDGRTDDGRTDRPVIEAHDNGSHTCLLEVRGEGEESDPGRWISIATDALVGEEEWR